MRVVIKVIKYLIFLGALFIAIDIGVVLGIAHWRPAIPKADAVIILGAAINTPALRNRTLEGLHLYQDGKTEVLVLSGGKIADSDISEAEYMRRVIRNNSKQIPSLIIEDQSHNTYENIKNSKMKLEGKKSVVIVSDQFHLARGVLLAKRAGFDDVYWSAPHSGYYSDKELRYYYIREFIAMINYIPKFIWG